jgi:hypothetical protein
MDSNKTVTAVFTEIPPARYTLATNNQGQGSINTNPAGPTHTDGQVVTLTAIPATGWAFSNWTGDLTGSSNPATITMNSNKAVSAVFERKEPPTPPRNVTLSLRTAGLGSGIITSPNAGIGCEGRSCTMSVTKDERITLVATPNGDSTFAGWSGACSGMGECSVPMNRNTTVIARFNPPPPPVLLMVVIGGPGSGSITSNPAAIDCGRNCFALLERGGTITLTATPASGSAFSGWAGSCSGRSTTCTLPLDRSRVVVGNFSRNQARR